MTPHLVTLSFIPLVAAAMLSTANLTMAKGPVQTSPFAVGTDSNPIGAPEVVIPEMYQPPRTATSSTWPILSLAEKTLVSFTPQDENTSATVLFLYNTTNEAATVGLQTFFLNGSLVIKTSILVPARGLVRICSDTVTTVSASWANYILVNFTTFSTYAQLTLPAGVQVDGYVAYDPTGVYDPLTATQMLPLRFSLEAPPTLPGIPH